MCACVCLCVCVCVRVGVFAVGACLRVRVCVFVRVGVFVLVVGGGFVVVMLVCVDWGIGGGLILISNKYVGVFH